MQGRHRQQRSYYLGYFNELNNARKAGRARLCESGHSRCSLFMDGPCEGEMVDDLAIDHAYDLWPASLQRLYPNAKVPETEAKT